MQIVTWMKPKTKSLIGSMQYIYYSPLKNDHISFKYTFIFFYVVNFKVKIYIKCKRVVELIT